jgi:hypothetical protein
VNGTFLATFSNTSREQLKSAVALNSLGINIARSI